MCAGSLCPPLGQIHRHKFAVVFVGAPWLRRPAVPVSGVNLCRPSSRRNGHSTIYAHTKRNCKQKTEHAIAKSQLVSAHTELHTSSIRPAARRGCSFIGQHYGNSNYLRLHAHRCVFCRHPPRMRFVCAHTRCLLPHPFRVRRGRDERGAGFFLGGGGFKQLSAILCAVSRGAAENSAPVCCGAPLF